MSEIRKKVKSMNAAQYYLLFVILVVIVSLIKTMKDLKEKRNENAEKLTVNSDNDEASNALGYYPPSPYADNPVFAHPRKEYREINHQFRMLRMEYDTVIKRHNRMNDRIRRTAKVAKDFKDYASPEMQEVIDLCKKDIQDAPALMEYAQKWAALQGSKMVYPPQYDSFRRLAVIYERQGKYEEAIDICNQAIILGIEVDENERTFTERRKMLIEKAQEQYAVRNTPTLNINTSEEAPKKQVKTTREELEAFEIVRVIAKDVVTPDRITYKDTLSYFSIQLDGNSRSWICRIKVEAGPKWVTFHSTTDGKNDRVKISTAMDLYNYRDKILDIISSLM